MNHSEISEKILENLKAKYDHSTIAITAMFVSFHSATQMQTHVPGQSFDHHFHTLIQLIELAVQHDPQRIDAIRRCLDDCNLMIDSKLIMSRQDWAEADASPDAAEAIVKNLFDGLARRE